MIYAKVNAQDREAIQAEMRTTADVKWYSRLKVIDLSAQEYSVPSRLKKAAALLLSLIPCPASA